MSILGVEPWNWTSNLECHSWKHFGKMISCNFKASAAQWLQRIDSHLNFETTKLLGPFTRRLLNDAMNSGPRLNWILSKPNGSRATVFLSPKSPVANRGRNPFMMSSMHSLGFATLREQVFIAEARIWIEEKLNKISRKNKIFCQQ